MRTLLIILFAGVFLSMAAVTTTATLQRGMFQAGHDLWPDWWFRATLLDAYCGFIAFYVWVAYKEKSLVARAGWFVGIMLLGNFAMSAYMLIQLFKTDPFSWERMLLRTPQGVSAS
ncbi:DUF1475 family protein [Planctomycetes bacterium K23_9]|uniref:DUF1475 domain-containing protein n=1 Tax=Stieleria marina TaxID=1930275 RepID=A0A517NRJ6_9BACT|nr:hypothetical protein K239x_17000 [Planctomycetes bacterium K23_9]